MTALVQFPRQNLLDVPEMMREVADQIEQGMHGKISTVIMLIPIPENYPKVFGWGEVEGENHPIVQLELAKHWLVANLSSRD